MIGETVITGTTVHFTPDPEIFTETVEFDLKSSINGSKNLPFSTEACLFSITDKRDGMEQSKDYHYEGGIASYVQYINENKESSTTLFIQMEKWKI